MTGEHRVAALWVVGFWTGVAVLFATCGAHKVTVYRRAAAEARRLGAYTLTRKLGAGGMGEVHLAEHRLLKRPCAVKLIRPEHAGDDTLVRRFGREVRAATRLAHPAAVQVYDYGVADDGTFYYVMEYRPGLTPDEVVRRAGPLPPARAVHRCLAKSPADRFPTAAELDSALAAAHAPAAWIPENAAEWWDAHPLDSPQPARSLPDA